jgi:UDP:flavonoid glycosyltransferase YjiC (YdhE family)
VTLNSLASELGPYAELGIDAHPIDPRIEALEHDDYKARSPRKALLRGLSTFCDRAPLDAEDLHRAIAAHEPDVLLIDTSSYGACFVAEASGMPWATFTPFLLPLPSRDVPPFGPGLAPLGGPLGRLRDGVLRKLVSEPIDTLMRGRLNPLRARYGLAELENAFKHFTRAPLSLNLTAEGFEYPRTDWPANVRLVGPSSWTPPADPPAWLDELGDPLVLVTCSTERQNDRRLIAAALAGLPRAGFSVLATTAAHEPASFAPPPGSRVERFVPHEAALDRTACVVCHGGMGITQKALARGVPVVVVPFGRDQLEVARRVDIAQAGVRLMPRRLKPERLLAAVRTAITRKPGAVRVSGAYAAAGGPARAADEIERLVQVHNPRYRGSVRAK